MKFELTPVPASRCPIWRASDFTEEEWRQARPIAMDIPGVIVGDRTRTLLLRPDTAAVFAGIFKLPFNPEPVNFSGRIANTFEGLKDYQKEGFRWLMENARHGCILADDMGMGKTRTALAAAHCLSGFNRTLIIGPAGLKEQWLIEQYDTRFGSGTLTFKSYESVTKEDFDGKETLICDEAHRLKKARGVFWKEFGDLIRRVPNRILLTGTPIDDRVRDFWGLATLLEYDSFGTYREFSRVYCGGHQGEFGWEDSDLPISEELKTRLKYWVLRRLYQAVARDLGFSLRRKVNEVSDIRELLSEVCSRADRLFSDGHSSIIFAAKRATVHKIAEMLPFDNVFVCTGEQTPKSRAATLRKVRVCVSAGEPTVTVATIAACGTGLNMDWASHGLFAELDFRATQILQAERRLFRVAGNIHDVDIEFFTPRDGTYDRAISLIVEKLNHIDKALGEDPNATDLKFKLAHIDEDNMSDLYNLLGKQEAQSLYDFGGEET